MLQCQGCPQLIHHQQANRHECDDDEREGGRAFSEGDDEDQGCDEDLCGGIGVDGKVGGDARGEGREGGGGGEDLEGAVKDGAVFDIRGMV